MIQATKIYIERAEGPCDLCVSQTFTGSDCWFQANNWLRGMADTYPKTGGYDKHDFKVEWEDGEKYEGRLDCKHSSCDDNDLDPAQHVLSFLTFLAGERCPSHMKPDQYKKSVEMLHRRGGTTKQEYLDFLAKYQIG